MAWKKGPLPKDTYGWGGVVPINFDPRDGFFPADFKGDHVIYRQRCDGEEIKLTADEVKLFDNSIEMPTCS